LAHCVFITVSVPAGFLESSHERFTGVQTQGVAGATPQEDIPHCLLGSFQSFFSFAVANVFFSNAERCQSFRCLQATGDDKFVAPLQPTKALRVAFPTDDFPGTKQSCTERALQVGVVVQGIGQRLWSSRSAGGQRMVAPAAVASPLWVHVRQCARLHGPGRHIEHSLMWHIAEQFVQRVF
jgi:hypothetical protein